MARAMVGLYCASFRQVPPRIVLDVDDTSDAVHGGQQFRLFNAHYDEYGFQPIVVFDGKGRPVAAMLRPVRRPAGGEACALLRRLARDPHPLAPGRDPDPGRQPLLRARGPGVLPRCKPRLHARRRDQHPAAARRSTGAEHRHLARCQAGTDKLRCFKEFHDGTGSLSRLERIIALVGAGPQGTDTRFVVTSLAGGTARRIYEELYYAREQAENHVKA
jgi:hypothetical protein